MELMSWIQRVSAPTILFAMTGVLSGQAQTLRPITLIVDGGAVGGWPTEARGRDAGTVHSTWFGGLSVQTTRAAMGRGWDFSVDAAFRREPTFAMARTGPTVTPVYLDALSASSSLRFAHTSRSFETAIIGRFAETRIDRVQQVTPATNTINEWSFLVDAAVDLHWYGSRGTPVRSADRRLMSLVGGHIGVQHDQRLHRAGDLQGFDDPTGRIEGGVFVTPWRLINARGEPVMAIGGGADMNAALRGGERLPSGFRVLLRAEVDLRHARSMW
jgi:hypothetical protein